MRRGAAPATIWTMPLLIAASTIVGLVAALVGDDWWDAASWVALSVPLAVCLWFSLKRADRP